MQGCSTGRPRLQASRPMSLRETRVPRSKCPQLLPRAIPCLGELLPVLSQRVSPEGTAGTSTHPRPEFPL